MMKRVKKPAREPGTPIEPQNSQFAPRPFAQRPFAAQEPKHEVHEAPSLESVDRAKRFGHSFADISIFPPQETVQPKLRLGSVNDRYEQEADQVARRVIESISSSDQDQVQRQEDLEDEDELDLEEGEELRRKVARFEPAGGADVGPGLVSAIHRARSGGQPLSDGVRQPMERAFGADFGGVRVHADGEADSLNRSIQARAFTTGQDVFFRQVEYRPGSSEWQRLLAHELTHVVQQNGGAVQRAQVQATGRVLRAKEEATPNRTGMPDHLKSGIESLSGMDLSGVRVHYNSPKLAQINALAYTRGQVKHLPHEGWHAVQQMQGQVKPTLQAKGVLINDDVASEREADVIGAKALQMTRNDQATTSSTSLQRNKRAASSFSVSKFPLADTSSASVQEDVIQIADPKPAAPSVQRKVTINGKEKDSIISYLFTTGWDELISLDEAEVAGWLLGDSRTWNFSGPEDLILYVDKVYSMTKLIRSVFASGILSCEELNKQKIDYVGSEDVGKVGKLAVNVLIKGGGKKSAQEIADESMTAENRGSISVALERQNDWLKASPDEELGGEWTKPEQIVLTSEEQKDIQNAGEEVAKTDGDEMGNLVKKALETKIKETKAYDQNQELLNNLFGPEMEERAQNTIMAIITNPSKSIANIGENEDISYESDVPGGKIPSGDAGFTTLLIPQWFEPFYMMLKDQQPDDVEVRFVGDKNVTAKYKSPLGSIPVTVNAPDYAGEVAEKLEEFKTIATHILTA